MNTKRHNPKTKLPPSKDQLLECAKTKSGTVFDYLRAQNTVEEPPEGWMAIDQVATQTGVAVSTAAHQLKSLRLPCRKFKVKTAYGTRWTMYFDVTQKMLPK